MKLDGGITADILFLFLLWRGWLQHLGREGKSTFDRVVRSAGGKKGRKGLACPVRVRVGLGVMLGLVLR